MAFPTAFFLLLRRCHAQTAAADVVVTLVATPMATQDTGAEPDQAVLTGPWRFFIPVAKWMAIQATKWLWRVRVPGWLPYAIGEMAATWLEASVAPRKHFPIHSG